MTSSLSKRSIAALVFLIPALIGAALWVYREGWFLPPEDRAASLHSRAQALERALRLSDRNRQERLRIVEALDLDDLGPAEAIEEFRQLNTEEPALWKSLKATHPECADDELVCRQIIIAALMRPFADSADRIKGAQRIRGKLEAYLGRPLSVDDLLHPRLGDDLFLAPIPFPTGGGCKPPR